jgi:hypothetical protein
MISELNKIRMLLAGAVALLLAFAAGVYSLRVEPHWLRETHLEVVNPRAGGDFRGLRIIFASDIHMGNMFDEERLKALTARINELEPHVVILGGDQISSAENITERFYRNFGMQINAPVYAVLGNHDYIGRGGSVALKQMAHSGIHSLNNAAYDLRHGGGRFRLAGVGDLWMGTQDLRPTFNELADDTYLVLVSHNPEFADALGKRARRVDLMLAGHLHGRQINPAGFLPMPRHSRVKGHYCGRVDLHGRGFIFISSGVGTSNLPVRFLARPEIVVIDIPRSNQPG